MARGGTKDVTSYSIGCQDCPTSWSEPGGTGWTSAYSAAQRHAKQQRHRLEVYQGRTWILGDAGYASLEDNDGV